MKRRWRNNARSIRRCGSEPVLLDTSAYSAFMRGDVAVKERLQTADAIYLNPVMLEGAAGWIPTRPRQAEKRRPAEIAPGFFLGVDCDRG